MGADQGVLPVSLASQDDELERTYKGEKDMGRGTVPRSNDLEEGSSAIGVLFNLGCDSAKPGNLDSTAHTIPPSSAQTVLVSCCTGSQESGTPGPC